MSGGEKKRPPAMTNQRPTAPHKPPPGIPLRPTGTSHQPASHPQSPTKARPAVGPKLMGTVADLTRGRKIERPPPPQPK